MPEPDQRSLRLPKRQHALLVIGLLAAWLLVGLLAFKISETQGLKQLHEATSHQLDLLAAAIDNEVTRHASIASAVSLSTDVRALLQAPAKEKHLVQAAANHFLEMLNDHLGGPAIFVLGTTGLVVASSDTNISDTLLGADLSGMPFFQGALAGTPVRHYAIDHVSKEPGFFIALPILDEQHDWQVIGVAVVKWRVREAERRLLAQEVPTLIVDANGIVLLASLPEYRYATLQRYPRETLARISREQFAGEVLGATVLDIDIRAAEEGVTVPSVWQAGNALDTFEGTRSYLALSRRLPETAWRIVVFSDLRPVTVLALTHATLAAAAFGCLLLGLLYLDQSRRMARGRRKALAMLERANQELEGKVAARTIDLSEAVRRLECEVAERLRAEQTLRAAQDERIHSAKLAVLGKMATGIVHELSQLLGAIGTLSTNAIEYMRRGDQATAAENLGIVGQLSETMGDIITPLKTFARKSPATPSAVDVAQAVDAALFLFAQRLENIEVKLPATSWIAWCDRNSLQLVLVNLIGNAIDAMVGQPVRRLSFAIAPAGEGRLALSVTDSGSGLSPQTRAHLFEPFFTTKPAGSGLGLGLTLSRDILHDFGGDLLGEPAPGGGARFIVVLPVTPNS
ncbi:MAG: ATP-binding protein [Candidatus Accumulibacter phosphatis]|jgi:C4-dicarboxylate-specific signal transduction histidine kinase|uniref:histidine kinase n=1 Tax=Candidatus Accumulibacter contiguus TaxID=2954381 RepID=A0ABX1T3T3_9PROT|nr:ATP-binding protein [Candidatus Accumulibacter contiguus]NMQ04284.1 sensor histidine kinase [Candidatus Accumulibacter contiguus]